MALQQSPYFNGVTYFRKWDSPKNCGYMRETKKLRARTHACLGGSICPYLDWNLNFRGADVGIIQIGPTVSKLSLET